MSELLSVCLDLKITRMLCRFPIRLNFSETSFTYGIYTEPRGFCSLFRPLLPFELTAELKITSQAAEFITQILFVAYGGSSTAKTLNQTFFHMWRMVSYEVEVSASVGGFPVDFGGQCHLYPDDQNIQKVNRRSSFGNVVFCIF
jgi:hypothetical protein